MGSYFVDRRTEPNGEHLVHERRRCPPEFFPEPGQAEYLGEYLDDEQAMVVAGLKYLCVNGCVWCATAARGIEVEAGKA